MAVKKMSKELVHAGQRFEMKAMLFSATYYFSFCRSNNLQIMRKGGAHQCYVSEIAEDGIYISIWIMTKEARTFIPYTEMTYIEPKN